MRPVYDPSTQFLDPNFLPSPMGVDLISLVEMLFRWLVGG